MNIPVKRRSAKPAGWPAPQEGGKYQQRRSAQTDGIDVHNRLKGRVQRKYPLDPGHADAANSGDGQTGRNKRNAKASKIPGLNFVQHAEKMGGYHGHQPYITDVHHRRVTVKMASSGLPKKRTAATATASVPAASAMVMNNVRRQRRRFPAP